ncbi:MAG: hypothetical protein IKK60_08535 [Clostridia bacterium]|nr:hypothetical protein [Clostridia bacterium]
MKKTLSILMSVLILALSLAMVSSAAAKCKCDIEEHPAGKCTCCIYCEELDVHYLTSCAVKADGTLNLIPDPANPGEEYVELCCNKCTGILPCNCGCACCTLSEDDIEDMQPDQIFDENQQEQIVSTFQKILNRFREFFDNFFEMIFELLRFDEIMGNN